MKYLIKYLTIGSESNMLFLIMFFLLILGDGQREPTVRVIAVSSPPPLRYVSVSRGGQITVWNSSFCVLRSLGVCD